MSIRAAILGDSREAIRCIAARHGAERIALFGSVARGDDNEDSDCDFLADFGPNGTLLSQAALKDDLEELLGRPVDVLPIGGLKPKHRAAAAEAIVL